MQTASRSTPTTGAAVAVARAAGCPAPAAGRRRCALVGLGSGDCSTAWMACACRCLCCPATAAHHGCPSLTAAAGADALHCNGIHGGALCAPVAAGRAAALHLLTATCTERRRRQRQCGQRRWPVTDASQQRASWGGRHGQPRLHLRGAVHAAQRLADQAGGWVHKDTRGGGLEAGMVWAKLHSCWHMVLSTSRSGERHKTG